MALGMMAFYKNTLEDDFQMAGEFSVDEIADRQGASITTKVAAVLDDIMSPEAMDALVKWTYIEADPTIEFRLWFDESKIDALTGLTNVG